MDTPERCKAGGTPISKFEDSPVFNFINSLSPIKPVKSVQSIQAFHSPCFATILPVFASPHVSSYKESRFLVRHTFPVSVKQNINGSILPAEVPSGAAPTTINALDHENSNISCCLNEATVDPADESSTRPDFSPLKQYGNCTPNNNTSPCYGDNLDFKLDNSCGSIELVQFVGDGLGNTDNSLSTDGLNVTLNEEQTKEGISGSDWEDFVSVNADDMLLVDIANESGASKIQEENGISVGDKFGMDHKVLSSTFQDEVILNEQDQRTEIGVNGSSLGCKAEFQQNREVRRRCLVFEVAAVSKMNQKNSSDFPSTCLPAKSTSDYQQTVSSKTSKVQVPCVLPGIGLHLNALATSSLDKMVSKKTKVPGREITRISSINNSHSENVEEKHSKMPLGLQRHQDPNESEIQNCCVVHSDVSQTHALLNAETNSPKKKKRRTEIGGDNEGCKRCHCKKSKCLKLYCECFAAGVYCVEPCSCQGCLNKPSHEDTVLATRKQIESRNPLAFAPKVIVAFEHDNEIGEESNKTPASARHKRGCNCKKSNCLKKYCECFQGGVGCSFSCRCEGCKNAFGMKFGSEETEDEKELDACNKENSKLDDVTEGANVPQNEISQVSGNASAITPFHACSRKPPRPSSLLLPSRARNYQAQCKDANGVEAAQDDSTTPAILSHSSPCAAVKTTSPNGKRVSLPLSGLGMSPNRKASRRLVLKSIPSFPSLCGDAATS